MLHQNQIRPERDTKNSHDWKSQVPSYTTLKLYITHYHHTSMLTINIEPFKKLSSSIFSSCVKYSLIFCHDAILPRCYFAMRLFCLDTILPWYFFVTIPLCHDYFSKMLKVGVCRLLKYFSISREQQYTNLSSESRTKMNLSGILRDVE